ncbi:MAG TPA: F0F1 ATP synthase subunit epsilon [Myxococcaceae bacterium]|nr:F0F1 ATP synthase subunit epsilon [Myxococcaceae bacterium]
MAKLAVEIVTPEKRILSVQADEVIAPGAQGLFGVRPGHTAFLSLMEPGALTLREGGSSQVYFVSGGFVEVTNDKVMVLADQAEPATDIDVEAARRRMAEAQERLKGMSAEDIRFEIETSTVRTETARMAVAVRR